MATVLGRRAVVARDQGDYVAAQALLEESLALWRRLGDRHGLVRALADLGNVRRDVGEPASAHDLFTESLALHRALGDERGIANSLYCLALVARDRGQLAKVRPLLEESLVIERRLHNQQLIALRLAHLERAARDAGDYAASRRFRAESLPMFRALGAKRDIAGCLEGSARLAAIEERPARAMCLLGAAAALRASIGAPLPPADAVELDELAQMVRAQISSAEAALA